MTYSSNGEVFGSKLFGAAIIIGSVAILLASITSPAPNAAVPAKAAAAIAEGANQS